MGAVAGLHVGRGSQAAIAGVRAAVGAFAQIIDCPHPEVVENAGRYASDGTACHGGVDHGKVAGRAGADVDLVGTGAVDRVPGHLDHVVIGAVAGLNVGRGSQARIPDVLAHTRAALHVLVAGRDPIGKGRVVGNSRVIEGVDQWQHGEVGPRRTAIGAPVDAIEIRSRRIHPGHPDLVDLGAVAGLDPRGQSRHWCCWAHIRGGGDGADDKEDKEDGGQAVETPMWQHITLSLA